ncbi:MAG: AbrB family transcriptional regulator [Candidatus Sericytochromatia bacterium]
MKALPLSTTPRSLQWGLLLNCTVLLVALLQAVHFPAALLLGALLSGILLGVNGASVSVARSPYLLAQALLGCLVASALGPAAWQAMGQIWPLLLGSTAVTLLTSSGLGWLLTVTRTLPGTTAIWGMNPGGASSMVAMAEDFGADARLVACMQYLRVLCVTLGASLVARFYVGSTGVAPHAHVWFPPLDALGLGQTLLLALCGWLGGRWLKLSGGALLIPLIAGAALQITGLLTLHLPDWLLAISYALLGWRIGLSFTREILAYAARALPRILGAIALLMACCASLGLALSHWLQIDPLTAYLATSPGGLDSAVIIAASARVDLPFVVTLQTCRLFAVMLLGPVLNHLASRAKDTL